MQRKSPKSTGTGELKNWTWNDVTINAKLKMRSSKSDATCSSISSWYWNWECHLDVSNWLDVDEMPKRKRKRSHSHPKKRKKKQQTNILEKVKKYILKNNYKKFKKNVNLLVLNDPADEEVLKIFHFVESSFSLVWDSRASPSLRECRGKSLFGLQKILVEKCLVVQ